MLETGEIEKSLAVCEAIYDFCKRKVRDYAQRGSFEQAASWAWLAAFHASVGGFIGRLADPDLEDQLLEIGRTLPSFNRAPCASGPLRVLHVLTEVYEIGGHTRLCQRWIELDANRHRHSVVLTAQGEAIPEAIKSTVLSAGGEFSVLDPKTSLLERATQLRSLACQQADIVVLHTHPQDVLPILAFALGEVPPVVVLNHSDYLFWLGGSVADLVADLHRAASTLTKETRGISDSFILPIPLVGPERLPEVAQSASDNLRREARAALGIPEKAVVFLTIGSAYKYSPIGDYSFLTAASAILAQLPHAYILAVGPEEQGDWATLATNTGGRLKAVGVHADLSLMFPAADIYLEGFPCGSLTALLEAGLRGIPCVRTPLTSKGVYCSDSDSISHVASPTDMGAYIATALTLGNSEVTRRTEGSVLRNAIIEHHCGEGWLERLASMERRIPERHRTYCRKARPLPADKTAFIMAFRSAAFASSGWGDFLRSLASEARHRNLPLQLRFDDELRRRIAAASMMDRNGAGARTGELYHFLKVEAQLAHDNHRAGRVFRNWIACLMIAPFARDNLGLTGLVLEPLVGQRIMEYLRTIKRRILLTNMKHRAKRLVTNRAD
jgi:hypothetical protein